MKNVGRFGRVTRSSAVFVAVVAGADLVTFDDTRRQGLGLLVAGRAAGVIIDGPTLGVTTAAGFVEIAGSGETTVGAQSVSTISIPFSYDFRFNAQDCYGADGQLTLSRR